MILPFFDHLPTSMWTFITLNVDQNGHFLTTYPPHLVHVFFDRPLKQASGGQQEGLHWGMSAHSRFMAIMTDERKPTYAKMTHFSFTEKTNIEKIQMVPHI